MEQELAEKKHYLSAFDQCAKARRGSQARWLESIRREAMDRFSELGFPTIRDEEWRFTNLASLRKIPFLPSPPEFDGATRERIASAISESPQGHRLVFINGHYCPELSAAASSGKGVRAGSLKEVLGNDPESLRPHLARYAAHRDHAVMALNTAFMEDGGFLYIPEGLVLKEPIVLLFVSTAGKNPTMSFPRNLIVADRSSEANILEWYTALDSEVYFTNSVSEIVAGENSVLRHYKLQQESLGAFHIGTVQAHLSSNSSFLSCSIALGGALVRNEINGVLDGEGIECVLNGLYMIAGRQHVDNHTRIDHVRPRCNSRELYKGILDGHARGVFNGKIYVHKDAQKTDARQTNKNLLLSPDALIDTKPQLEIHADDVKCSHGSTIGQLDQDSLFYLRSRGIGLEDARRLLTYAFASDIIGGVQIESVRCRLDRLLVSRLGEQSQDSL
ncbi:MAG: Fe-S cluster assembly protein SufD [Deltaproteobacteria bacterium]|nr:Fe-S cluster assembly protein SufD [Deltaproteobacteria bacterium]